jgi:nitrogen fixation protein FixH
MIYDGEGGVKMIGIESISVADIEKKKVHKLELSVTFKEPVTAAEAQDLFLEAISDNLHYLMKEGVAK